MSLLQTLFYLKSIIDTFFQYTLLQKTTVVKVRLLFLKFNGNNNDNVNVE